MSLLDQCLHSNIWVAADCLVGLVASKTSITSLHGHRQCILALSGMSGMGGHWERVRQRLLSSRRHDNYTSTESWSEYRVRKVAVVDLILTRQMTGKHESQLTQVMTTLVTWLDCRNTAYICTYGCTRILPATHLIKDLTLRVYTIDTEWTGNTSIRTLCWWTVHLVCAQLGSCCSYSWSSMKQTTTSWSYSFSSQRKKSIRWCRDQKMR